MKDQVLATISSENKLFLDLDTDFIIQDVNHKIFFTKGVLFLKTSI